MRRLAFIGILFCFWAGALGAVEPDEVLANAELESRARTISANLRCTVCQNESIDTSAASLARDLRLLVRARLTAGDSDQQVYDYIVARYGAYVLFDPPLRGATLALWAMPFVVLMVGGLAVFVVLRSAASQAGQGANPLSAAEKKAFARMMGKSANKKERIKK